MSKAFTDSRRSPLHWVITGAQLNLDDSEQLLETITSDGFKVLLHKVIPYLNQRRAASLLQMPLTDLQELLKQRAIYDGSEMLSNELLSLKELHKHL